MTGREVRLAPSTIASWYYTARRQRDDPVSALRRAVRKDRGKISLAPALSERLQLQYCDHQGWSFQLHYDNLAALVNANPSLGRLPSYSTVKHYMQAHGLLKKSVIVPHTRPGEVRAERKRQTREVRSYEAQYVGAVWHLDFHHGSTKVLTAGGRWLRPSLWASSTITRGCAATCSGTSPRPRKIWSTDSLRRSRSGACRVLC